MRGMTWNPWLENLASGDPGVCGTLRAYSELGFSWSINSCLQSGSLQLPGYADWNLLHPFTVRTADQHRSRRKQKGQIFKFSLCKAPNQASGVSAESLLCPVGDMESVPSSGHCLATSHGHAALASICKTAAMLHEPTIEEFPWMKTLRTAQGFYDIHSWPLLTSSLGCCFLLILNCQCVLFRAISRYESRFEVHTALKLVPELASY